MCGVLYSIYKKIHAYGASFDRQDIVALSQIFPLFKSLRTIEVFSGAFIPRTASATSELATKFKRVCPSLRTISIIGPTPNADIHEWDNKGKCCIVETGDEDTNRDLWLESVLR
jgi:hypothetical protein